MSWVAIVQVLPRAERIKRIIRFGFPVNSRANRAARVKSIPGFQRSIKKNKILIKRDRFNRFSCPDHKFAVEVNTRNSCEFRPSSGGRNAFCLTDILTPKHAPF